MESNAASSSSSSSSPGSLQHSQWLHTALSDLDEKMKAVMSLLEEDDKSSCQKPHISHNRKQLLVEMLGDLSTSYRSLVHMYDQLRSKPQSLFSNSREVQHAANKRRVAEASDDPIGKASYSRPESVLDDPDFEPCKSNFECLNKFEDDLISTEEQSNMFFMRKPEQTRTGFSDEDDVILEINGFQRFKPKAAEFQNGGSETEDTWIQLKFQFTKLMEENLRLQAEMLRRNEAKRQTINGLRLQLEHLKSENQSLLKCLHSQTSRSRGLCYGKFFPRGCH